MVGMQVQGAPHSTEAQSHCIERLNKDIFPLRCMQHPTGEKQSQYDLVPGTQSALTRTPLSSPTSILRTVLPWLIWALGSITGKGVLYKSDF